MSPGITRKSKLWDIAARINRLELDLQRIIGDIDIDEKLGLLPTRLRRILHELQDERLLIERKWGG